VKGIRRNGHRDNHHRETPVGTAVGDIFDVHNKNSIYGFSATVTLAENPQKNEEKLSSTTEDMFKHFPPKGKG
jgi:hypothetical protein